MGVVGYKVSISTLLEVNKLLKRADRAINTLQRANNLKMVYPELQADLQKMMEKLESQYTLSEFKSPSSRDSRLEKAKKDAGQ